MTSHLIFVISWFISFGLGLPFGAAYLALASEQQSSSNEEVSRKPSLWSAKCFFKAVPVMLLTVFLLVMLFSGIGQRTWYAVLTALAQLLSMLADMSFVASDEAGSRKHKSHAKLLAGLSVGLFFLVQLIWIVIFTFPAQLSSSMDGYSGPMPAKPQFLLIFIIPVLLLVGLMIKHKQRFTTLDVVGVLLYATALATSVWRAAARLSADDPQQRVNERIYTMAGISLFAISDATIFVDHYIHSSHRSKYIIMPLYWIAQALLTLAAFVFV